MSGIGRPGHGHLQIAVDSGGHQPTGTAKAAAMICVLLCRLQNCHDKSPFQFFGHKFDFVAGF